MVESLDAVSLYFRAIKDFPELSREAFNTLWHRANKGDKAAKKELVERNLRLVIPIAKKYYRPGLDFLDIIEEGNLGLMHAIDKFDPTKGFRFSTYGAYWISFMANWDGIPRCRKWLKNCICQRARSKEFWTPLKPPVELEAWKLRS